MASPQCSISPSLIIDIPPKVLDQLCRCIDCLLDWEWLRFVSNVMSDETTVQRFLMKRRAGDNATRELLWSWGQRMATVQDLEEILQTLELYRALDILRQNSTRNSPGLERQLSHSSPAAQIPMSSTAEMEKVTECGTQSLPLPPPPPAELLSSLLDNSGPITNSDEVLSMPQQEISLTPGSLCQQWTRQQLEEATERFSADRKMYSGQFADIYRGQKGDRVYAIKWLKEVDGDQTDRIHSFFQTEAQVSFRCAHPNLLPLLGFCLEFGHRCLIYHYMQNGSLDAALQEDTRDPLSWEKRLTVAAGLLQAVRHLHEAGLFHGNIKSSNVFLDDTFSPKLGHSGPRFCPDPSASYTQMKTQDLQRYQPYLPDTYMRRGQLTAQTDIFSVGVVLAELLTGYKPCDKSRDPSYLKDLILKEMEQAKVCAESAGDKKEPVEHLCAREVAQKHADVRPGRPTGSAAFYLACAACLCLSKKKVLLLEVIDMIEKAETELRMSSKESQEEMSSWNVPEESDEAIFPGCAQLRAAAPSCHSPPKAYGVSDGLNLRSTCHMEASEILIRGPCELDESGQYFLSPGGIWCDLESDLTSSKAATSASTNGHTTNHHFSDLNSPSESDDPSWGIEVNMAKMQLMQNIELYEDEKVDSSVLFDS